MPSPIAFTAAKNAGSAKVLTRSITHAESAEFAERGSELAPVVITRSSRSTRSAGTFTPLFLRLGYATLNPTNNTSIPFL
jgi:hypothetical protein